MSPVPNKMSPQACGGDFGRTLDLPPGGAGNAALFDLSRESDLFSAGPTLLAINLSLRLNTETLVAGEMDPFAQLRWSTGGGSHYAEMDLLVRGSIAFVVAGDGLQVNVLREGPNADPNVSVRGTVGFAGGFGGAGGAQRTVAAPGLLPLPVGTRLVIPAFARVARVVSDIAGGLAVGGFLRIFPDAGAGTPPIQVSEAGFSTPIPLPLGAVTFDVLGIAGQRVRVIFELSL